MSNNDSKIKDSADDEHASNGEVDTSYAEAPSVTDKKQAEEEKAVASSNNSHAVSFAPQSQQIMCRLAEACSSTLNMQV